MLEKQGNGSVEEVRALIRESVNVLRVEKIRDYDDLLQIGEDLLSLYKELYRLGNDDDRREACRGSALRVIPLGERLLRIKEVVDNVDLLERAYRLYRSSYAFTSRRSLSHFIDFMEWERTSHRKVYLNRKEVLDPFIFYLNKAIFDSKLKYVVASYPPSYGKTFVVNYFSAWLYGMWFDSSVLRISYSEDLVNSCSRSVKDLIESDLFYEVFENFKPFNGKPFEKEKESDWKLKGADVLTSHYARTRDGAITGVRANRAIIIDDITKGEVEATNSSLHLSVYTKWQNEWFNRREGTDTLFIFVGTMWSPEDILNRIVEDNGRGKDLIPSKRFKHCYETDDGSTAVIRVPLLDENDMSTCEVVMTTEEALHLRNTNDDYFFSCVYQQNPIAPSGLEFAWENLNTFINLPTDLPKYSFAVLDPARKGKDNVSMPVMKEDSEGNYFLVDVLFQKKAMEELYDSIVDKIIDNDVVLLVIENNIDTSLAYVIREKLKARGYDFCEVREKFATINKEQRIMATRGIIVRKMWFKDKSKFFTNSDYGLFMKNLTRYSFDYVNKHDDAPDSLALFSSEIIMGGSKPSKPKQVDRKRLGF